MLYQLSYARVLEERVQVTKRWLDCKCSFSRQARLIFLFDARAVWLDCGHVRDCQICE